jgi:MFS family permease
MKRYIELFRFPNVWALLLSSFPARLAYGMVGLSVFFKAQQETGSIAFAGVAVGLNGLAGALTAGIRGTITDKWGMKWPLRILAPAYTIMLIALNLSHDKTIILIFAIVLGFSAPPINLSVRPLWKDAVPDEWLRTAYAVDTATQSTTGVVGPVIATALALSVHPGSALLVTAIFMFIGGNAMHLIPLTKNWKPEAKPMDKQPMWRHRPFQLLLIEGSFIGFGWGVFDVAVPAFATIEDVPHRVAWVFTAMGVSNILGGLFGGLVSKNFSPLKAIRIGYIAWFIASLPLAFTYPGWSMVIAGAFIGFTGGIIQVFYWEVTEAVRPQGAQSAMLGWLWTVEGSIASLGSTSAGWFSEQFSPRGALALTTICIGIGLIILNLGKGVLAAADKVPTPEEDLAAMKDNVTNNQ